MSESWYQAMLEDFQEMGEQQFNDEVFDGLYQEYALDIIHPSEETKTYESFDAIYLAFINAYV